MSTENYLCISADIINLPKIRGFIQESVEAYNIDEDSVSDIVLAVDEITTNIIVHGYQGKRGKIEIAIKQEGYSIIITVSDRAKPFDPTKLPVPDISLPLEKRQLGGLGFFIARKLMDEVTYNLTESGENQLILIKDVDFQTIKEET